MMVYSYFVTVLASYIVATYVSHKVTEKTLIRIEHKVDILLAGTASEEDTMAQVPIKKRKTLKDIRNKFLSSDLSNKDEEAFCPLDKEDKPLWERGVEYWEK